MTAQRLEKAAIIDTTLRPIAEMCAMVGKSLRRWMMLLAGRRRPPPRRQSSRPVRIGAWGCLRDPPTSSGSGCGGGAGGGTTSPEHFRSNERPWRRSESRAAADPLPPSRRANIFQERQRSIGLGTADTSHPISFTHPRGSNRPTNTGRSSPLCVAPLCASQVASGLDWMDAVAPIPF